MTKLESVMQKINSLSTNEQEKIAEFIEFFAFSSDDKFIFSDAELLEIDERLKFDKKGNRGLEETFAVLN